jgi:hypothetical protein
MAIPTPTKWRSAASTHCAPPICQIRVFRYVPEPAFAAEVEKLTCGVGLSFGDRWLRVGIGEKGHHIRAGANGFYYKQTGQFRKPEAPPLSRPSARVAATSSPDTWVTDDGVVTRRLFSAVSRGVWPKNT